MRYPAYMLGLMLEFWHDATMFERIPPPSEPPSIIIGTKVCERAGKAKRQSTRVDKVRPKSIRSYIRNLPWAPRSATEMAR